jgi:microsomal dipeptidase-like Zn-dependent dipeptidase
MSATGEGDMTTGYADLHCHPMVHLAFGGRRHKRSLFWGDPLKSIPDALPGCGIAHAVWHARRPLAAVAPMVAEFEWFHAGYDGYRGWPKPRTRIHQQMHITQVRRAYDSGLRVMVASAVNNELLADAYHGVRRRNGDEAAIKVQLAGIRRMANVHGDWMAIVETPQEAWNALEDNKLAIILAIEVDSIAGPTKRRNGSLTEEEAEAVVERWWRQGVRLINPIHLADSGIGGTAVYNDLFNCLNHYLIEKHDPGAPGPWFLDIKPANGPTADVRFLLGCQYRLMTSLYARYYGSRYPAYIQKAGDVGHVNTRGLTAAGAAFIKAMMKKGMLIDVEHMSSATLWDTLAIAQKFEYPLISSHTGIRDLAVRREPPEGLKEGCAHEAMRTGEELLALKALGGVLGIGGHAGLVRGSEDDDDSTSWALSYWYAVAALEFESVAIGTDMNGFARTPGPRFDRRWVSGAPARRNKINKAEPIAYGKDRIPCLGGVVGQTALGRRAYDFNFDGLAHYGLLPDFTVDVELSLKALGVSRPEPMAPFFRSADAVVAAWEMCRGRSLFVRSTRPGPRVPPSAPASPLPVTGPEVGPPDFPPPDAPGPRQGGPAAN